MKLESKHWMIIAVTPLAVLADQFSKQVIHSYMHIHDKVTVIPGYLNLYYVRNSGLVFGLFADELGRASTWVYLAINLFALAIIARLFSRSEDKSVLMPLALSLVLAGALGNLIDRLRWGYVVDFVQIYFVSSKPPHNTYSWGIFNLADVWLAVGIGFLIIDAAVDSFKDRSGRAVPASAAPPPQDGPSA